MFRTGIDSGLHKICPQTQCISCPWCISSSEKVLRLSRPSPKRERQPSPDVFLIFDEKPRQHSASRPWDFQLAANRTNRALLDFAVSRHGSSLAIDRIFPDRMIAPFTNEGATLSAQMTLQIKPFHDAANWSSSRTAPGVALLRASSRWQAITCSSASQRFDRASSTVSPSEKISGHSSKWQVKPPSSAGSKTAVSLNLCWSGFTDSGSHAGVHYSSSALR
jgi:hypothetical protein